ncbi:hypothetical protein BHE74_00054888, partial [Ensete ventricosum]
MRTARYRVVPPKSIVGCRFQSVLAEGGRKKWRRRGRNLVPLCAALLRFRSRDPSLAGRRNEA